MRRSLLTFPLLLTLGCQTMTGSDGVLRLAPPTADLPQQLESLARRADAATERGEQLRLAAEGMAMGDTCVEHYPRDASCYYYRAMATGLYYKVKVIGYQTGVKQMIADARKAIMLAPDIDHAGPFRMLGELFTQLPKTTIHPEDATRDLDLARHYLSEAVTRSPEHPENQEALCAALIAGGEESACKMGLPVDRKRHGERK
ncbi:MAG: hypothetical protein HYV03_03930 [Deltaproteobacteria bacterium]|nr:hypothetical protein [Deltaproteobacteria bacterium]